VPRGLYTALSPGIPFRRSLAGAPTPHAQWLSSSLEDTLTKMRAVSRHAQVVTITGSASTDFYRPDPL